MLSNGNSLPFVTNYYKDLRNSSNNSVEFVISDRDFNIDEKFERMRILGLSVNIIGGNIEGLDKINEKPVIVNTKANATALNNDINNQRSLEYAQKTNSDTYRQNLLFYCEVIPATQNPKLDYNIIYEPIDQHNNTVKSFISNINDNKDDISKYINIKTDAAGTPIINFKPTINTNTFEFPNKLVIGDIVPLNNNSLSKLNINFSTDCSIQNTSPIGKWKVLLNNVSLDDALNQDSKYVRDIVLTFKIGIRKF